MAGTGPAGSLGVPVLGAREFGHPVPISGGVSRYWHEFWPQILAISFAVGVAGNLVASVLWAFPALWHLHRKLNRQHAERMVQAARHHKEQMAALRGDRPGDGVV